MANFYRVQGSKDLYDATTNQRIADPKLIGTTYTKDLGIRPIPNGAVPLTPGYDKANTTQVTPVGSTLYGVPKKLTSDQMSADTTNLIANLKNTNTQLQGQVDQYQNIPQPDYNAVLSLVDNYASKLRSPENTVAIETAAGNVKTASANVAAKQNELKNYDINTQSSILGLEGQGRGITTGLVRGQQAVLQQQRSLERQGLAADESNLINLYNIADQNLKTLQDQQQTATMNEGEILKLKMGVQDSINQQKQWVYQQAQSLQEGQKSVLAGIISSMSGINPDALSATQTHELTQLAAQAGVPFNLVVAGLKAKYQEYMSASGQAQFDQNLKLEGLKLDRAKFASDEEYRQAQLLLEQLKLDASTNPSNQKATVDNYKAAGFHDRTVQSDEIIKKFENVGSNLWGVISGNVPNVFKSAERQELEQAERNFVNAVLRVESGAAISQSEFDNAAKQYFPQPGDSDAVLKQKQANRETVINNFQRQAGPALTNQSSGEDFGW